MDFAEQFRDNCGFGLLAQIHNQPSHQLLHDAIKALSRMMHRGAIAADGKTGDGCGLLCSMPHKFMRRVAEEEGISLPKQFAVATLFLSRPAIQLESVRKDFVANVSHELKTPITAIRGAVETLLDEDDFTEVGQRFLQIIFKQNERLNALVEDLLDLSRIEQGDDSGGWELSPNKLLPILEGARNGCESLLTEHQVCLELKCRDTLQARINPGLLEQAVINLLATRSSTVTLERQ